jgi:hypothetical protein
MGFTEDYSKVQPEQLCEKHSIMYRGVCPMCADKLDPKSPESPLTLYAQKTPSGDVRLFRRDGSIMVTSWSQYQSGCPTHRNKWVTVNCYRWRLMWLPGVCSADQYSESGDSEIIRQYGVPRRQRSAAKKPRLTR